MAKKEGFIEEPTMSDTTLLVTVEDLINRAMGPPEGNVVDFKLIQTILHILARQQRMLEQRVEIRIIEVKKDRTRKKHTDESSDSSSETSSPMFKAQKSPRRDAKRGRSDAALKSKVDKKEREAGKDDALEKKKKTERNQRDESAPFKTKQTQLMVADEEEEEDEIEEDIKAQKTKKKLVRMSEKDKEEENCHEESDKMSQKYKKIREKEEKKGQTERGKISQRERLDLVEQQEPKQHDHKKKITLEDDGTRDVGKYEIPQEIIGLEIDQKKYDEVKEKQILKDDDIKEKMEYEELIEEENEKRRLNKTEKVPQKDKELSQKYELKPEKNDIGQENAVKRHYEKEDSKTRAKSAYKNTEKMQQRETGELKNTETEEEIEFKIMPKKEKSFLKKREEISQKESSEPIHYELEEGKDYENLHKEKRKRKKIEVETPEEYDISAESDLDRMSKHRKSKSETGDNMSHKDRREGTIAKEDITELEKYENEQENAYKFQPYTEGRKKELEEESKEYNFKDRKKYKEQPQKESIKEGLSRKVIEEAEEYETEDPKYYEDWSKKDRKKQLIFKEEKKQLETERQEEYIQPPQKERRTHGVFQNKREESEECEIEEERQYRDGPKVEKWKREQYHKKREEPFEYQTEDRQQQEKNDKIFQKEKAGWTEYETDDQKDNSKPSEKVKRKGKGESEEYEAEFKYQKQLEKRRQVVKEESVDDKHDMQKEFETKPQKEKCGPEKCDNISQKDTIEFEKYERKELNDYKLQPYIENREKYEEQLQKEKRKQILSQKETEKHKTEHQKEYAEQKVFQKEREKSEDYETGEQKEFNERLAINERERELYHKKPEKLEEYELLDRINYTEQSQKAKQKHVSLQEETDTSEDFETELQKDFTERHQKEKRKQEVLKREKEESEDYETEDQKEFKLSRKKPEQLVKYEILNRKDYTELPQKARRESEKYDVPQKERKIQLVSDEKRNEFEIEEEYIPPQQKERRTQGISPKEQESSEEYETEEEKECKDRSKIKKKERELSHEKRKELGEYETEGQKQYKEQFQKGKKKYETSQRETEESEKYKKEHQKEDTERTQKEERKYEVFKRERDESEDYETGDEQEFKERLKIEKMERKLSHKKPEELVKYDMLDRKDYTELPQKEQRESEKYEMKDNKYYKGVPQKERKMQLVSKEESNEFKTEDEEEYIQPPQKERRTQGVSQKEREESEEYETEEEKKYKGQPEIKKTERELPHKKGKKSGEYETEDQKQYREQPQRGKRNHETSQKEFEREYKEDTEQLQKEERNLEVFKKEREGSKDYDTQNQKKFEERLKISKKERKLSREGRQESDKYETDDIQQYAALPREEKRKHGVHQKERDKSEVYEIEDQTQFKGRPVIGKTKQELSLKKQEQSKEYQEELIEEYKKQPQKDKIRQEISQKETEESAIEELEDRKHFDRVPKKEKSKLKRQVPLKKGTESEESETEESNEFQKIPVAGKIKPEKDYKERKELVKKYEKDGKKYIGEGYQKENGKRRLESSPEEKEDYEMKKQKSYETFQKGRNLEKSETVTRKESEEVIKREKEYDETKHITLGDSRRLDKPQKTKKDDEKEKDKQMTAEKGKKYEKEQKRDKPEKVSPKKEENLEKYEKIKHTDKFTPKDKETFEQEKTMRYKGPEKITKQEKQKWEGDTKREKVEKEGKKEKIAIISPDEIQKWEEGHKGDKTEKNIPKVKEGFEKDEKMVRKERIRQDKIQEDKPEKDGQATVSKKGTKSDRKNPPYPTSIEITEKIIDNEKILVVERKPVSRADSRSSGSIDVVTRSQFELLAAAVQQLRSIVTPQPLTMPDNEQLMSDVLQGTATLPGAMQTLQVDARLKAAENAVVRMAGLLTALASAGELPDDMFDQLLKLEQTHAEMKTEAGQETGLYRPDEADKSFAGRSLDGKKSVAIDPKAALAKAKADDGIGYDLSVIEPTPTSSIVSRPSAMSRSSGASSLTAAKVPCVTYDEMMDALKALRDDILKCLNNVTAKAASLAETSLHVAKGVAEKLDVALQVDDRISILFSVVEDYAEQLRGFDSGLATQMQSFQDQMAQMRTDLQAGLVQLEKVNNNAETAAVLELTERYEELAGELESTLHAHKALTAFQEQLSAELRGLVECMEMLREQKADRDEVLDGLRDKADTSKLAGLLSEAEFAEVRADFERRIDLCHDKFHRQDEVWQTAIRDLKSQADKKAELVELLSMRDDTQKHLQQINDQIRCLAAVLGEPKAALVTRKLAEGTSCGACRERALMEPRERAHGAPRALPALRPPPLGAPQEPCLADWAGAVHEERSVLCATGPPAAMEPRERAHGAPRALPALRPPPLGAPQEPCLADWAGAVHEERSVLCATGPPAAMEPRERAHGAPRALPALRPPPLGAPQEPCLADWAGAVHEERSVLCATGPPAAMEPRERAHGAPRALPALRPPPLGAPQEPCLADWAGAVHEERSVLCATGPPAAMEPRERAHGAPRALPALRPPPLGAPQEPCLADWAGAVHEERSVLCATGPPAAMEPRERAHGAPRALPALRPPPLGAPQEPCLADWAGAVHEERSVLCATGPPAAMEPRERAHGAPRALPALRPPPLGAPQEPCLADWAGAVHEERSVLCATGPPAAMEPRERAHGAPRALPALRPPPLGAPQEPCLADWAGAVHEERSVLCATGPPAAMEPRERAHGAPRALPALRPPPLGAPQEPCLADWAGAVHEERSVLCATGPPAAMEPRERAHGAPRALPALRPPPLGAPQEPCLADWAGAVHEERSVLCATGPPAAMEPRERAHGAPRALPALRPPPLGAPQEPCLADWAGAGHEERHICHRWAGGSHTLVSEWTRRAAAPPAHYDLPTRKYTDYGDDGRLYKLEAECQPCAECNLEPDELMREDPYLRGAGDTAPEPGPQPECTCPDT